MKLWKINGYLLTRVFLLRLLIMLYRFHIFDLLLIISSFFKY